MKPSTHDLTFDAERILESIGDAFFLLDREWAFAYVNPQAERLLSRARAELLGRNIWDEFPEAVGTASEWAYRRAVDEQAAVTFEELYAPLNTWMEVRVYPSADGLSVFYQDVTARKRSEEALRRSQDSLRLAVEGARLGTFYCDYPLDRIVWNDTCKEHFFLPPDAEVDFVLFYSLLHPDDREPTRQAIERALAERVEYDVEYRTLAPDGRTRWVNAVGRFYYGDDGNPIRFDGITLDISARKAAEEALRASEEALRENGARLRDAQVRLEAALAAGGIGTWTWDVRTDSVVADAGLARLFSVSPEDAAGGKIGVYLQAIHPEDRSRVQEAIEDSLAYRGDYEAEYRVVLPDGSRRWLATRGRVERDAEGQAVSLPGVVEDITERVERGRRERFLADLAERARGLTDPDAVIADAVTSVGEFLGVSRCVFADIDIETDDCTIPLDYCADESVASMAGTFPISAFGPYLVGEYGAGRTVVAEDVRADPERFRPEHVVAYDAVACRAFIAVPVLHSSRLVSVIAVHSPTVRHWEPEEVEMLRAVVERTWLTVEVLRQQYALACSIEEQRARAEREALVSQIGQALLATTDPAAIQGRAVTLVGEALGADRCYISLWDATTNRILAQQDHHRAGLPSVAGEYSAPQYAPVMDALFARGTAAVPDVREAGLPETVVEMMTGFGLNSVLAVPFFGGDGRITAALVVAMTAAPRVWTPEEVSLAETAAALTRTAVEAARVHQREHRIAEQLQSALQPPIPERVPGMRLAEFYRPAWADQGVGGDFSDVFSDVGVTFLVVGDLSGKGLVAASSVATVRHMLRFALLNGRSVAGPVNALNRTVAEHGMILGFATLFVGRYDTSERTLTYVNCGQDAGLILQSATGEVESMPPTGPVLGAFSGAEYTEATVALGVGDVLAVYTDGLTEAGPSRTDLLTGEGVADLLRGLTGVTDPRTVVERLMAGVDSFAGSGVRDDQCLLVGVVTG